MEFKHHKDNTTLNMR